VVAFERRNLLVYPETPGTKSRAIAFHNPLTVCISAVATILLAFQGDGASNGLDHTKLPS
jgi:hypothetical protein